MTKVFADKGYKDVDAEARGKYFDTAAEYKALTPYLVFFEPEDVANNKPKVELSEPTDVKKHKFWTGDDSAKRYELKVGDQIIPIYVADHVDEGLKQLDVNKVAAAIAAMPEEARRLIKQFDIHGKAYPNDKDAAMSAGKSGVVDGYSQAEVDHLTYEFAGYITHETGHIASQKAWGRDSDSKQWKPWRDAMKAEGSAPSRYGNTNPQEDFAETWELYFEVRGTPDEKLARETFPKRFALIDDILAKKK
jgi:hypothetical protein